MPFQITPEKIQERIAMFLRKAERTNSPQEAEAFTEAAEKLALRFGIDMATAQAQGQQPQEDIILRKVPIWGQYRHAHLAIYTQVAAAMGLKSVKWTFSADRTLIVGIIGHASDVDAAVTIAESLVKQSGPALRAWWRSADPEVVGLKYDWRTTDNDKFKARRGFLLAFAVGARARIERNRHTLVEEVAADAPGTELVLLDRSAAVERHYKEQFGKIRKGRKIVGDHTGARAGYQAGLNADTGDTRIGGQKALGAR